jgi:hypothetical protein
LSRFEDVKRRISRAPAATPEPEPTPPAVPPPGESIVDPDWQGPGRTYPGTAWRSKKSRESALAPGGYSIFGSDYH